MYARVADEVFPFIKSLGGRKGDSTYAAHMKDARFTIPSAALLAKVVDMLDAIPMDDRDTKGDLYEYMLGQIASAGQNGQFRTPRHQIGSAACRGRGGQCVGDPVVAVSLKKTTQ